MQDLTLSAMFHCAAAQTQQLIIINVWPLCRLFAFLAQHRSEYVVAPEDVAAKQASNSGGSTTSSPGDSQIHADTPEQRLMQ